MFKLRPRPDEGRAQFNMRIAEKYDVGIARPGCSSARTVAVEMGPGTQISGAVDGRPGCCQ
eukprot:6063845-Pyramimonas_sp.AAC.1